jgi:ApaG protein
MKQTEQVQIKPVEYYSATTENIQIEVVPEYLPDRSNPSEGQFFYGYNVRITNLGDSSVKIIHRHWKIKDGKGHIQEVQGQGIGGVQPVIKAHEFYEYSSFSPLKTRGKYELMDEFGNKFWVDIPLFFLRPPQGLIQ